MLDSPFCCEPIVGSRETHRNIDVHRNNKDTPLSSIRYGYGMFRPAARLDPDIATVAALIGDPSRAAILSALTDGRALPAGELARAAHISPQTDSSHLDKLFKGNLIAVEVQGRHHYYRLRDSRVAELLESLALVARPAMALTTAQREKGRTLRFARTCYGHLAAKLGVMITEALCAKDFLFDDGTEFHLGRKGAAWFHSIGIVPGSLRRPLARRCLDWSERRHHLAGPLGVALTRRFFELHWLSRGRERRFVNIPDSGRRAFRKELDIEISERIIG
jgi:DNA-binding transcriptional ArsR family regulator